MKAKFITGTLVIFICLIKFLCAQNGFSNKAEAANQYANGLKQSKWVEYKDSSWLETTKDKAVYYRLIVYNAGKPYGIVRDYYMNEQLQFVGKMISSHPNILDGLCKWYYKSGTIWQEISYTDGKKNGIAKQYYENGKIKEETPYTDDKKKGIAKQYYESGKIHGEIPYSDNKENGILKIYYESGKLKWEIPYNDDKENGIAKGYDENGKTIKEISYTDGKENK